MLEEQIFGRPRVKYWHLSSWSMSIFYRTEYSMLWICSFMLKQRTTWKRLNTKENVALLHSSSVVYTFKSISIKTGVAKEIMTDSMTFSGQDNPTLPIIQIFLELKFQLLHLKFKPLSSNYLQPNEYKLWIIVNIILSMKQASLSVWYRVRTR